MMSEEQTQDNNPEVNHVKDMIDSLSNGDNIGAEKSFKDGLAGKISAALDTSRQDVAAAWLNEPQPEPEVPEDVTDAVPSDPKPEVADPSADILPDETV
jgi:hypothetical protein|tara:strand:+ start:599 stop:895 length:297 start_codon:yes stop_codon:yes gene_type:complete